MESTSPSLHVKSLDWLIRRSTNLNVKRGDLRLELTGHLLTFIKTGHASSYVFFFFFSEISVGMPVRNAGYSFGIGKRKMVFG